MKWIALTEHELEALTNLLECSYDSTKDALSSGDLFTVEEQNEMYKEQVVTLDLLFKLHSA